MADTLKPSERSRNMAAIRSKNMRPEIEVRRWLHEGGYRYRLHAPDLPGKPDIVFRSRRKVIFVHGCFWHQHDDAACLDGRRPKSRLEYWNGKLDRNIERDARNQELLQNAGWRVLIVWECETKSMETLFPKIVAFLDG